MSLLPPGFDNLVRVTSDDATSMNAEIAAQNIADYLLSAVAFDGTGLAFLFFGKNLGLAYLPTAPQLIKAVGGTQGDLDTDKATQAEDGYVPTGVFCNGPQAYVLYQQLADSGA